MTGSGYARRNVLLIGFIEIVLAFKGPTNVGFSVGRVSEGQFEYEALNGRMTPR